MSEIVVATFPDKQKALAARNAMAAMGRNYQIEPSDIEVVSRAPDRAIDIEREVQTAWTHVIGGAVWGAVLGAVFLMPVIGAAVGAGAGFITGRMTDIGIRDAYLRDVGRRIEPGQAAVALLARRVDPGALAATISRFGGKVTRSSLSGRHADQIRTATVREEDGARTTRGAEKAEMRDQPDLA
ncbi:DUF1269 domain-containing protein [Maritimibacter sp. UBA3975]|uniref:DUF1269 domain-containing protein n=1 Tax=Maritimibacter sp. UBA3975 TaxID=1946833 RepID=UPI000C09A47B|nr:DUF1269 domain-containing protein [Maritimibacter sp. UBA3975]MAM63257.1 hypothetical protein [Maritimibacter sp.]